MNIADLCEKLLPRFLRKRAPKISRKKSLTISLCTSNQRLTSSPKNPLLRTLLRASKKSRKTKLKNKKLKSKKRNKKKRIKKKT